VQQVRNDSGGEGALAKILINFAKSEDFLGVEHSAEQLRGRCESKEARGMRNTRFHWQRSKCAFQHARRQLPIVLPLSHKKL